MTIAECADGIAKTGQKVIFAYHKELECYDVLFVSPKTKAMVVKLQGLNRCKLVMYLHPFIPDYYLTPDEAWQSRKEYLEGEIKIRTAELDRICQEKQSVAKPEGKPKELHRTQPVQLSLF